MDKVVKIRGLRVDTSEVEAALHASDLFEEVAVTALEDRSDGYRLVACVVPHPQTDCSSPACRRALEQFLPVPSRLLVLEELPLLANGKIDRVQLLKKAAETSATKAKRASDTLDALELHLVRIWEKVLDINAIGTTDDFFALGGHSLRATVLIARIRDTFQLDIPMRELFQVRTIAGLAQVIERLKNEEGARNTPTRALPAIERFDREGVFVALDEE